MTWSQNPNCYDVTLWAALRHVKRAQSAF